MFHISLYWWQVIDPLCLVLFPLNCCLMQQIPGYVNGARRRRTLAWTRWGDHERAGSFRWHFRTFSFPLPCSDSTTSSRCALNQRSAAVAHRCLYGISRWHSSFVAAACAFVLTQRRPTPLAHSNQNSKLPTITGNADAVRGRYYCDC